MANKVHYEADGGRYEGLRLYIFEGATYTYTTDLYTFLFNLPIVASYSFLAFSLVQGFEQAFRNHICLYLNGTTAEPNIISVTLGKTDCVYIVLD